MLPVGWRTDPQIDNRINYLPGNTVNDFGMCHRGSLEMHASQNSLFGSRVIFFRKPGLQAMIGKDFLMKCFDKRSSFIPSYIGDEL